MATAPGSVTSDKPPAGPAATSRTPAAPLRTTSEYSNHGPGSARKPGTHAHKQTQPLSESKTPSKSHDNLASTLRKKAISATLTGNKENLNGTKERAGSAGAAGPKRGSKNSSTPIRKAQSTPHIDKSGTPMKRTQSAQNVSNTPVVKTKANSAVKKSASTQNISTKDSKAVTKQVRIAAPSNIMAYNAELLASFEKEKRTLERRISELIQVAETRKTDIERYKFEVRNLREQVPSVDLQEELDMLRSENKQLKDRLLELGISVENATADSQKLRQRQRLQGEEDADPGHALAGPGGCAIEASVCSSAESLGLSLDVCDKSSDATSEVSVACLQDRITQMEENHYCTSEELQATLQELTDLQQMVNELSLQNEQISDEKQVLLESLCAQTEKLQNCRLQIEHLKALLVSESEQSGDRSEHERQLVVLLHSAQEEHDELMLRQCELSNTLKAHDEENRELQDIISALRDKVQLLELENDRLSGDKQERELQHDELKEKSKKDKIEMERLQTLLDQERTKVSALEQSKNATGKSELEELLDAVRQEKNRVEKELTEERSNLARCQNEAGRLREVLHSTEEDARVARKNLKSQVKDFQYQQDKLGEERDDLKTQVDSLRDHIDQLQCDCDRYVEEKESNIVSIAEMTEDLRKSQNKIEELETELFETRKRHNENEQDWKQFQADLQTAVVIANDFKMESQQDSEKVVQENIVLKEKLEATVTDLMKARDELEALRSRAALSPPNPLQVRPSDIQRRMRILTSADRDLATIRQGSKLSDPKGQQCLSVKNLIQTLEPAKSSTPVMSPGLHSQNNSRRNSSDSSISCKSVESSPVKPALERRSSVPVSTESSRSALLRGNKSLDDTRTPPPRSHRHARSNVIYENVHGDDTKNHNGRAADEPTPKKSILTSKRRRSSLERDAEHKSSALRPTGALSLGLLADPLAPLVQQGGSKRNALLKWCQMKTANYPGIDLTNFSSSWTDGLAFCAILHSYLPDKIPFRELNSENKTKNLSLAFKAGESVGIPATLNINDVVAMERPDWQGVIGYITNVYKHFEVDK